MIKQSEKLQQHEESRRINYTKWAFVLGTPIALIGALAAVIVVPEIRCSIGWKAESCSVQKQPVEIITQDETGSVLSRVRVQVISQGAPEVQTTDDNGYVQVQIPSKGKIVVNLSKEGYPTQNITIDLENEQSTTRRVTLGKSGNMQVQQILSPNPSSQQTAEIQQKVVSENIQSPTSPNTLNLPTQSDTNLTAKNSDVFPDKYIAIWEGTATFTNSETKSTSQSNVTLSLNSGKIGSKAGDSSYGGCRGSLILRQVKSNSVEFFENITSDYANCTKNNIVTVTFMGDDIIEFKRVAIGNKKSGSGLLTRQK
jgi:hypothetical protein